MRIDKPRGWSRGIPLTLILLLVGAGFVRYRPGIDVTVRNAGEVTLRDVVVHVTGAAYGIGDLAPGASAKVTVTSKGESHLELEVTDAAGVRQRHSAGGYFLPGAHGAASVELFPDGVGKVVWDLYHL